MTLRILSYNIRFGGRGRERAIAEVLRALNPDVAVLQEATDPAVIAAVAAVLDLRVVAADANASVAVIGRATTANVQRLPLRTGRTCVALDLPDHGVRLYGVHLSAGLSRRGESRRLAETRQLLWIIDSQDGRIRSAIIGDLNAISPDDGLRTATLPLWIRILLQVDGGIQTAVLAGLTGAGYVDAYRRLNPADAGPTMPAARPSVRLDYLLVDRELAPLVTRCEPETTAPSLVVASDHLPLVADLDV